MLPQRIRLKAGAGLELLVRVVLYGNYVGVLGKCRALIHRHHLLRVELYMVEPVPVRSLQPGPRQRRGLKIFFENVPATFRQRRTSHHFDGGDAVLARLNVLIIEPCRRCEWLFLAPQDLLSTEHGSLILILQLERCSPALRDVVQLLLI